jgi:hypothetical protein
MSSSNQLKNSYTNFSKVMLESINDAQIDDENLEPQFIRQRANNYGDLFIGTSDKDAYTTNPAQLLINGKSLITRKIRRLGVSSLSYNLRIPNVNQRNNTVTIFSQVTASFHSINLTEGYYTTVTAFITEFINKLNLLSFASGITFSAVVNPVDNQVYTINSVGGNFYFDPNSSMAKYGLFLVNLNTSTIPMAFKVIGPIQLTYTRYIDVVSNELCQYNKNPSGSTEPLFKANNLVRIFLFDGLTPTSFNPGVPASDFYIFRNIKWFNYNRTQSIGTIDLGFYDEFGNYLYIPDYGNSNTDTVFWVKLALLTEL